MDETTYMDEITTARKTLLENCDSLEEVANFCEDNYTEALDKRGALEHTKNYTTQSLASVAYQINTLATSFLQMLDVTASRLGTIDKGLNSIGLTIDLHQEKVGRQNFKSALQSPKDYIRSAKMVKPDWAKSTKPTISHVSAPIDYSILDNLGHGIKLGLAPSSPRTSRSDSTASLQSLGSSQPTKKQDKSPRGSPSLGRSPAVARQSLSPGGKVTANGHASTTPKGRAPPRPQAPPQTASSPQRTGADAAKPASLQVPSPVYADVHTTKAENAGSIQPPPPPPVSPLSEDIYQNASIADLPPPPPPEANGASTRVPGDGKTASPGSLRQLRKSAITRKGSNLTRPVKKPPPPPPDQVPPPPAAQQHTATDVSNPTYISSAPPAPQAPPAPPPPVVGAVGSSIPLPPAAPPPPPMDELPDAAPAQTHDAGFQDQGLQEGAMSPGARMSAEFISREEPAWAPKEYSAKVVAIFDYEAMQSDEMTFREGDVIYVTNDFKDGWLMGVHNGVTALVPGNYVEQMP